MFFHPIEPVYNDRSAVLILGSFPSVKSRETRFYYGHPQNRFWKLLSILAEEETPETIEEKKSFLLRRHIALWDVIGSCDVIGSADSTIRNVTPNDLALILSKAPIRRICLNGGTAARLYERFGRRPSFPVHRGTPDTRAPCWRCRGGRQGGAFAGR